MWHWKCGRQLPTDWSSLLLTCSRQGSIREPIRRMSYALGARIPEDLFEDSPDRLQVEVCRDFESTHGWLGSPPNEQRLLAYFLDGLNGPELSMLSCFKRKADYNRAAKWISLRSNDRGSLRKKKEECKMHGELYTRRDQSEAFFKPF